MSVESTRAVARAGQYQGVVESGIEKYLGIRYADVPFTFNWLEEVNPMLFVHPPTAENQALADRWSRTVIAFARSGSPNGAGLPDWPRYEPGSYRALRVTHNPEVVDNPDGEMLSIYRVA